MIVEMKKLNLVAMAYDKDRLLNALQRTGAAEVKLQTEEENTFVMPVEDEALKERISAAEAALGVLSSETENYLKDHKIKSDILEDGFEVSYTDFMEAPSRAGEAEQLIERVNALADEKNRLKGELSKADRMGATAEIYASLQLPFSSLCDTSAVAVRYGTIPVSSKDAFVAAIAALEPAEYRVTGSNQEVFAVAVFCHKSVLQETEKILQEYGFSVCPFADGRTGEQLFADINRTIVDLKNSLAENAEKFYELGKRVRELKIYCDRLGFELEKVQLAEKMRATESTFLLEAYVPDGQEEYVKNAVTEVTDAAYFEFTEPTEEEMPPTLLKNGKVVENFEALTNMYSVPNYRELDPNKVMAFFYALFLGFIMADIGYGLMMLIGGGLIWRKCSARKGSLKSLAGVFAVGGVFAIIWGVLFNSLFGIALPFPTLLPDAQSDMWSFMGIEIPAVLVISLLIGVVQLLAGYVCRAVQCWRHGHILDGIFDGMVWAVFSLGVGIALVGLVDDFGLAGLAPIGGVVAVACLAIAVLTAGRKEKFFGKFTKGFGAAYGIINYASDILSYARLYGLMLSGTVIAQIVSQYAIDFILGGNVGLIILGVVLMPVGHIANFAIGLLGAYIHDARLQYVEFYGRFYEGEGELFTPLGSQHKYVWLAQTK